jgi:hypothetical protein
MSEWIGDESQLHSWMTENPDGDCVEVVEVAHLEEAIRMYEQYVTGCPELMAALDELRGNVLGCWCAPAACHGDVLARLANANA